MVGDLQHQPLVKKIKNKTNMAQSTACHGEFTSIFLFK